jgi:arginine decarboxylase
VTSSYDQTQTPYLDALLGYVRREPGRAHVPGHKGGSGTDPKLREAVGEAALKLDIPSQTEGIDLGAYPTAFDKAQSLAASAWGARRSWFLVNGASQGNHAACLALSHLGKRVIVQRNVHSSTIDGLILAGLEPTFVAPELDSELRIAHCLTPDALAQALHNNPDCVGAIVVSPTYFGACADVRALAEVCHQHGAVLVVDEAWGAHFAFHERLPQHALGAEADLVISSTHKMLGSLTQSAILHLGTHEPGLDEHLVDRAVTLVESTSPSSLLFGSLDATRRLAAVRGRELLAETMAALATARGEIRALSGLDVLDERLVGRPGVYDYDPLRLAVDVRKSGVSGYEIARVVQQTDDINFELCAENVVVALFGMAEPALSLCHSLVAGLERALGFLAQTADRSSEQFAPPPPWGELVMSPREAFFAPQRVVAADAAVGSIAAEPLAAYPPGVPNVLPGERLTRQTLDYMRQILEKGGSLRGPTDRRLKTVRIVKEG